jgi:hypothetical protein
MNLRTIYLDKSGPLIRYDLNQERLLIDDLNPECHIEWLMFRGELFWIGLRMIRIALFGR